MTTTWRDLLHETTELLGASDARRLIEQASGHEGAELVLHLHETPTQRAMAYFDSMLERRKGGEPLQYVLGRWGFRMLDLAVDQRALIPRFESEEVAGAAIAEARRLDAKRVADLGTGAGGMGLSMAVELGPHVEVWLTDISADAVELARENTAALGRAGVNVRLAVGSWYDPLPDELQGTFDVIVANPPYVRDTERPHPEVYDWEPHVALFGGPDGQVEPAKVIEGAVTWLARPGALVMEHAAYHGDAMVERAQAAGFDEVEMHHDMSQRERWIVARFT